MKISINVSEQTIDSQTLKKIKISGAIDHEEALQAAEKWCVKNNYILLTKEFENPVRELENTSTVFFAKMNTSKHP